MSNTKEPPVRKMRNARNNMTIGPSPPIYNVMTVAKACERPSFARYHDPCCGNSLTTSAVVVVGATVLAV